ncbi:hypothetical protein BGX27_006784, partial [Mortierella sp. AM989]
MSSDVRKWLNRVELVRGLTADSDDKFIKKYLLSHQPTWEDFKTAFTRQYRKMDTEFDLRNKLYTMTMKGDTDTMDYLREFDETFFQIPDKISAEENP